MATPPLKFNFKELGDLNEDLKRSPRSVPVIAQRVMSPYLRAVARDLRSFIPRVTGQLARSLFSSATRPGGLIAIGAVGLRTRKISGRTMVAGNVMQRGGATPKKRAYLWVPLRNNRNITPQDFFHAENTFIRMSGAGNKIAFIRQGNVAVPLFVLKKSIRPAAPPLPINERVEQKLPEILEDIQDSIGQVIAARRAALGALD